MSELDQRRVAGLAGFGVTTALLVLAALAYRGDYLASLGWQGGEYAWAFVWIAVGSVVLGVVITAAPSPWRAIGTGMWIAGSFGVVLVFAVMVLFMWALSQAEFTF